MEARLSMTVIGSLAQRPAHLSHELRGREWLLDEREAAIDSDLVYGGLLGVAGHVQRTERGCSNPQSAQQLEAAAARHDHVRHDQIDRVGIICE
jgi:hypothetical protein